MANAILGHYGGYLTLATKLRCAIWFIVPAREWNGMTPATRWADNRSFLDMAIMRNDKFVFSRHPSRARRGGSFFQEIVYLQSRGIRILPTQDAYIS